MANKLAYVLATVFIILSFVLCLVGFGTGSWWVSTDPESKFDRAGLWEICFNGYEHTSDLIGKAYYGCWWVFYKEYYYIRDWIFPAWYVAVQTLMTFAVVFEFLALAVFPCCVIFPNNTKWLWLTCFFTAMITMCISTSVTIFGVMIGLDRTWMPDWHTNVLGWSFGLAVIAGFFATFSFIAIVVYTLMVKYEIAVNKAVERQPETKKVPMIPKI